MALTRIDNPTPSAPSGLPDYVQILAKATNTILQSIRNNSQSCIDFANNFARAGVVFHIGGVLYKAVTDQAIGGTPSKYIKITPSGATAAIDYVASLAGVTWSDDQSGYYDGSGNLYVFDEARAVYDGVVSAPKTNDGQIAYIAAALNIKNNLTVLGDVSISGDVGVGDDLSVTDRITGKTFNGYTWDVESFSWDMDSSATKVVISGAADYADSSVIKHISVIIWNNVRTWALPLNCEAGSNILSFIVDTGTGQYTITMQRAAGGIFDNSAYNGVAIRGQVFVIRTKP